MGIDQSGEYDARPVIVDISACVEPFPPPKCDLT